MRLPPALVHISQILPRSVERTDRDRYFFFTLQNIQMNSWECLLLQAWASLPLILLPTTFLLFSSFSSVPSKTFHFPSSHSLFPFLARQLKQKSPPCQGCSRYHVGTLALPQGPGHLAALPPVLHSASLPSAWTESQTLLLPQNFTGLTRTPSLPAGFCSLTNARWTGQ